MFNDDILEIFNVEIFGTGLEEIKSPFPLLFEF
jgi:hypothetical protein